MVRGAAHDGYIWNACSTKVRISAEMSASGLRRRRWHDRKWHRIGVKESVTAKAKRGDGPR